MKKLIRDYRDEFFAGKRKEGQRAIITHIYISRRESERKEKKRNWFELVDLEGS